MDFILTVEIRVEACDTPQEAKDVLVTFLMEDECYFKMLKVIKAVAIVNPIEPIQSA